MANTRKRSGDDAGAPTEPAAGLDACFGAMRLEDPPSLHRPEPLRVPVPTSTRADQYASILGSSSTSSFFDSHFGPYSPRFNPLAAEFPSVSAIIGPSSSLPLASPSSSMPESCSTSHPVPPHGTAFAVHSELQHQQPIPDDYGQRLPHVGLSQLRPQPELHQPHHQPVHQLLSSAPHRRSLVVQHDNATGIDPYAYAYLSELQHANNNQMVDYYQPWTGVPAVRRAATLQEVRSRLLRGPMDPALVMSPRTAAHVVRLLREGGEVVRRNVLAGVLSAVHSVMESREGRDVFLALLRACARRFDELRAIVHALCGGEDVLMDILQHDHGVTTLKALITAVAPHHQLSETLIFWLLREGLTEHCKCGNILNHCFVSMHYETCSIMIWYAIHNIDAMLSSTSGSIYLVECFAHAKGDELSCLEEILLCNTREVAMGQYSNYFLQRALELGSDDLKERIARRVAKHAAALSGDKFGSYVVESCILLTCSLKPMRRVLVAFLNLRSEQLAELVQGSYANYVVHKLLAAAKRHYPEETTALARRIQKLPAAVQRDMHAQGVMRVIEKQFPRKSSHY